MEFIFIIAVLILSVVIHELAHGYAALAQGDPTAKYAGRLTMNPVKHLDLVGSFIVPFVMFILPINAVLGWAKPVPYNPYNLRNQRWGEALVAGAGPASNFLIAAVFGLFIRFAGDAVAQEVAAFAGLIVLINLILGIFNLLPIPPLDGSKILFSVLPQTHSVAQTRMMLEQYGLFIVLALIILAGGIIFPVLMAVLVVAFSVLTGDISVLQSAFEQFFPR